MDEGATPLVACPDLADEWGVGEVYVKDEARNPTGSVADRGMAVAVTAAAEAGAENVALPTTGIEGQAAAAYAARAGLESHSFVPSRATFDAKAMINVHGGDMEVVGGRYGDAVDAFRETVAEEGWHSLAPFGTPYRRDGQKTLAYELAEQLDWDAPDAVVYPTGEGVGLVGAHAGAQELAELGLVDETPAMYAAQADGCAPVVEAFENDADDTERWETPDTICGGIEIPDPAGGADVLAAVRESDGGAVATEDREALEGAVSIAQSEGVEIGASAGVAASGAAELADRGEFGPEDTVVLVNTLPGNAEADILRNHLVSKGI
jgi:threonine synthase